MFKICSKYLTFFSGKLVSDGNMNLTESRLREQLGWVPIRQGWMVALSARGLQICSAQRICRTNSQTMQIHPKYILPFGFQWCGVLCGNKSLLVNESPSQAYKVRWFESHLQMCLYREGRTVKKHSIHEPLTTRLHHNHVKPNKTVSSLHL